MGFKLLHNFQKNDVIILNSDKTNALNGIRNTSDGLWDVTIENSQPKPPLTTTITEHANYIHRLDKKKSELSSYLHDVAGLPTKSMLET